MNFFLNKKTLAILIIVATISYILGLITGSLLNTNIITLRNQQSSPKQQTTSPTTPNTQTPPEIRFNETTAIETLSIKATNMWIGKSIPYQRAWYIDYIIPHENYKFVAVKIEITNNGTKTLEDIHITSSIITSDGKSYKQIPLFISSNRIVSRPREPVVPVKYNDYKLGIDRLYPDETTSLCIFYEIPEDAEPSKIDLIITVGGRASHIIINTPSNP